MVEEKNVTEQNPKNKFNPLENSHFLPFFFIS